MIFYIKRLLSFLYWQKESTNYSIQQTPIYLLQATIKKCTEITSDIQLTLYDTNDYMSHSEQRTH